MHGNMVPYRRIVRKRPTALYYHTGCVSRILNPQYHFAGSEALNVTFFCRFLSTYAEGVSTICAKDFLRPSMLGVTALTIAPVATLLKASIAVNSLLAA